MTEDEMKEYLKKPFGDGWKNNPRLDKAVVESIERINREQPMTAEEARKMIAEYRANAEKVRTAQSKGK